MYISMDFFKSIFDEASIVLEDFKSNPDNFTLLELAGNQIIKSFKNGNKIITCGNGGSMSDAMHMAEELTGRFRDDRPPLPAIAISDPGYLTCTANDYGFEVVFSRFIEGVGKEGDTLVAISTSGNSPNILNAVKKARHKKLTVIGLTGADGGKMAGFCDVAIRVPFSAHSDRIQEMHIKIIHALIQYIEENIS
jgi:D-sedoheptulose 7-phosphate isomerase